MPLENIVRNVLNFYKMKFVDIKNDVAFRKIFGNENRKEVLISISERRFRFT
jgi:hypothetical protein